MRLTSVYGSGMLNQNTQCILLLHPQRVIKTKRSSKTNQYEGSIYTAEFNIRFLTTSICLVPSLNASLPLVPYPTTTFTALAYVLIPHLTNISSLLPLSRCPPLGNHRWCMRTPIPQPRHLYIILSRGSNLRERKEENRGDWNGSH